MLTVNIIGLSILFIFVMFIVSKKGKTLSDYYLVVIILFFAGILYSPMLLAFWESIEIYLLTLFINTLYFPVLISYGLLLMDQNGKVKKKWIWVYIFPVIINIIITIDVLFINDFSSEASVKNLVNNPQGHYLFFYLTQYIYVIVVLLWLLSKLNRYSKEIKSYYSSIEHINLNWFRYFILSFLGLSSIAFIIFISFIIGVFDNIEISYIIEYIIFVSLLFYLCYNGIKQYSAESFKVHFQYLEDSSVKIQKNIEKYSSSSLSDNEMDDLFKKIKNLFDFEEIYLEPQLKIDEISKQLNVTSHKVSQTINTKANKPFYDFVNQYRVEYFKKTLSNPENRKFTILALGIESGFNSKASLNRIFKQQTGISPKEFQKKYSKK